MSNELHEIVNRAKSDAKKEKIANALKKHKKIFKNLAIFTLTFAVVASAVAIVQNSRAKNFSSILHKSMVDQMSGDIASAVVGLKTISDSAFVPGGVRSIAMLRYAALTLQSGSKQDATKIYQELNQCFFCNGYAKDLAGLLLVKIWISDNEEFAKSDIYSRIDKVASASKSMKAEVLEQKAYLKIKQNDFVAAQEVLEKILKEKNLSPLVKERAENALSIVAPQAEKVAADAAKK